MTVENSSQESAKHDTDTVIGAALVGFSAGMMCSTLLFLLIQGGII